MSAAFTTEMAADLPKTLTSPAAQVARAAKIQDLKKEFGISREP